MLQRAGTSVGGRCRRRAITGAAAIAVAIAAGIITVILKSNRWSYLMAVGFIAALLANGSLMPSATRPGLEQQPGDK